MNYHDNIILGGGPAALQCGYFFNINNIKYVILEKNDNCGSFFDSYPHSGQLISINKKYTGTDNLEFNLRHDWNSLLTEDNFRFTNYTNKYYPDKKYLVDYLNDFSNKYKINIEFNKNIILVEKTEDEIYKYKLVTSTNHVYKCKNLIVATGLSKHNIPTYNINVQTKIKHYGEYKKDFFKDKENLLQYANKDVCIIGGGNSSYELANILNEYCRTVTILSNGHHDWAISSHYSGDIRSIYLQFLDTFLLKSLNAVNKVDGFKNSNVSIIQSFDTNGKYSILYSNNGTYNYVNINDFDFDDIIFCTGWKFDNSIFNFDINIIHNKYPKVNNNYESVNNKNLFFIGSLMHSLDYKKSSGGFIHGFRYLIKSFVSINYTCFLTSIFELNNDNSYVIFVDYILNRINMSSAIYQMFGYIGDMFYFNNQDKHVLYYHDIPINYYYNNNNNCENFLRFVITLEYGDIHLYDIRKIGQKFSKLGSESKSSLLHPVIKIFNNSDQLIEIVHFDEDLYSDFTDKLAYKDRIIRLLKSYS